MKHLLREPLLQFLVAGAVLFGIHAYFMQGAQEAPAKIVVTTAQIDNLAQTFARTWQRQPSRDELSGLIEDHIRDEIYYREGKALGVDSDDIVIRRRIRQKMEFFAEDITMIEPTDGELAEYLSKHAALFRRDDAISFQHLYLSSKRGEGLDDDAARVSAELVGKTDPNRMPTSDVFLLGNDFDEMRREDVEKSFGDAFAAELLGAPERIWKGPIASPFGLHFVFVREKNRGGIPPFEDIRSEVERELANERRKAAQEASYRTLRMRYDVVVEQPPGGGDQQTGSIR